MACEMFVLGDRDFRLPGLGSFLQTAAGIGDTRAVLGGLAAMVTVRVHLAPQEFEVLRFLVVHQGKPARHRLLQTEWSPDHGGKTESLRVVISQLRRAR